MGVSTIAEQVALSLALNSILVRAGAMAHDLGRVAFGRIGEEFIAERLGEDFSHEKFAIFVLEIIERKGKGLNLSYETLRAIRNHSSWRPHLIKNGNPVEEDVLMLVDIWSNILSDYDDLHRIKIEKITLPDELMLLGDTQRNRINNCARALWLESRQKGMISFEESKEAINFKVVKEFMEQEIFPKIDRSDSLIILEKVYSFLEWYFSDSRSAALALALMSEEGVYVIGEMVGGYGNVFIKEKIDNIYSFAVAELLPFVPQWAELDFCNPDRFLDKNNFGKIPKEKCFAR
jgi:dGTPase